jgi:hypothetical protein
MSARHDPELVSRLLGPDAREVSCEECFALLDEYVERELAGEHPETSMPAMRAHLAGCPACREDHEGLRDLVKGDDPR